MPAPAAFPFRSPAGRAGASLRHWLLVGAVAAGLSNALAAVAEARPIRGGVGGPASGAGVRPGAGWGAPGVGLTRAPAAAYGAAVYHPGWAGGGYWGARPWTTGWYGAAPLAWWGTAAVVGTAAVTSAVNAAAAQQTVWIVVPQTSLQLNYASVTAVGNGGVSFTYQSNGLSQAASGDCRGGLLNGVPAAGDGAQLLNAACQVAYGSGG